MDLQYGSGTGYCRECVVDPATCRDPSGLRRPSPTAPTSATVRTLLDGRNPPIAALLSALFPEPGHIYAGDLDIQPSRPRR